MSQKKTLDNIISEVFQIDAAGLTDETVLQELEEWDSMMHMVFVTELEKAHGVQFTGEEIAGARSIGDIKSLLRKHEN